MVARHNGVEIVVDPWTIGSCYWRSWWNFPEPTPELLDSLKPDYIYITHLHWDHFHGPSLRRFSRDTTMLVPKLPTTRRMVEDLNWLGFHDVVELSHGETKELGGGLEVTAYQSGLMADSTLVIHDGHTTIVNANDCKVFGRSLKQIAKRFPKVDFVLRSHSSASPVPYCVDEYPERFGEVRAPQEYAEEFMRFAFALKARHAIPFASNHCFLHRETEHFNSLAMDPQTVHDYTNQQAERLGVETRAVLMPSGSRWSAERGFEVEPFDYGARDVHIARMKEKYKDKIERSYAEDDEAEADVDAATKYFGDLCESLPPRWLARRMLDFRVLFEVEGKVTRRFLLDFGERRLLVDPPIVGDVLKVRTPARVFNDCCTLRMFSTWSASKRLSVSVPAGMDLGPLNRFLGILDFYELGAFPLRNNLSGRSLMQRLLRYREPLDFASYVWRSRTSKDFKIADLLPAPQA